MRRHAGLSAQSALHLRLGVGVCTLDVENHCDGRVCPSPLTCVADECRTQCSVPVDCVGGVCVSGTCDERAAGIDAGVDDASMDSSQPDAFADDAFANDANWPDAYMAGQACIVIQSR